ncbi:MAG: small subunit ribosomal protein S16 [Thalassolituus oleivorans]
MVKLRLRRMGRRKRPLYAIVAADARSPRDGRFIEDLGRYDALQEPATLTVNQDRVLYWLLEGAQPSDTVRSLLSRDGIMLALHMHRKGAEAEAIDAAVEEHRTRLAAKWEGRKKTTVKDRKEAMLAAEGKDASARASELAKIRADSEAKAKDAADSAQREAAAERLRAAEEAKKAQDKANEEAKNAQGAANKATSEAEAAPAEVAPAAAAPAAAAAETKD